MGCSMSQVVSMPPPPVRNDDKILEAYVDGTWGINYVNGNMHFTFVTIRTDHTADPASQYRQVTTRLVMPLAAVIDLQNNISNIMSLLQQQGIIQPIMPGTQTRQ